MPPAEPPKPKPPFRWYLVFPAIVLFLVSLGFATKVISWNVSQFFAGVLGITGALVAFFLWAYPVLKEWRRLVRIYPDCTFVSEHTFPELSGQVAGGGFGNAIWLALGPTGLRISQPWPLRFVYPAFVVPWAAVISCRQEPMLFYSKAIRFDIAESVEPIHLRGFLWRHGDAIGTILIYWQDRHSKVVNAPLNASSAAAGC